MCQYTYNPAVQDQSLHMLHVAFGSPYLNLGYFPYCILLSNLALYCVRCCEYVLESKTVQNSRSTDRLQYNDFLYSPCMTLHCAHSTHVK
eukprot:SAG22_NODE_74_length_22289_cov_65.265119_24_plen_90_part_00